MVEHAVSDTLEPRRRDLRDATEADLACLPFAFAESWGIPCAYERSIKLSVQGVFANRYLLGFPTRILTISELLGACDAMGMPRSAQPALVKRYSKSLTVFIGYEQANEVTFLKVYLGFEPVGRRGALSHIGWKWKPRETRGNTIEDCHENRYRLTLYRRRGFKNAQVLSKPAYSFQDPVVSRQSLIDSVLTTSWNRVSELFLTEVTEMGGRRSVDWNIYTTGLTVGHFADQLCAAFADCGCVENAALRFLELDSFCQLGHLAYGRDWNANGFCTLYYSKPNLP